MPFPIPPSSQERTASAILEAAADVLSVRPEASMAEVATAAGVGRATVYRHFPSREELLRAMHVRALDEAGRRLADAALESVDTEEALARAARALLSVGSRYAVIADRTTSAERAEIEGALGAPLRGIVERARAAGELRADLPDDWVLELWGGLLRAGLSLSLSGAGVEEAGAAVTRVFLEGVRPPAGDA